MAASRSEAVRLDALRRTGLLGAPSREALDRITGAAARLFDARMALLSLVDADRLFFASAHGLPEPWASRREAPLTYGFCPLVVQERRAVSVTDARLDTRLRDTPAVSALSMVAYLGVPVRGAEGEAIGSLCVTDATPRAWTARDADLLQVLADGVTTELALHRACARLEERVHERTLRLEEEAYLGRVHTDVASLLSATCTTRGLDELLDTVARMLAVRLDAAFVRIWLLDEHTQTLVLRASAGMYTRLDGTHARVRVGDHKIGRIAASRSPRVTNAVVGDPAFHDQAWARREGICGFVGYPLEASDQVVGVLAMFSRSAVSPRAADTFGAVAALLGQAVARALTEAELREAREALEVRVAERTASLEASVRTLEELLSTIAHDLRAPNRAIRGYAELLLQSPADLPPDVRQLLERIAGAAARSDALLLDLLELGRVAHADSPLAPLSLAPVVTRALQDVQPVADRLGASIRVALGAPRAVANPQLLERVLVNLLRNALHYGQPGVPPDIEIRSEPAPSAVRLRVSDRGVGIPAEHQTRIFEPFVRLPPTPAAGAAPSPRPAGTGMGLALVRKAAERMHARVGVEPRPDGGSSFWVELPAPDAP